MEILLFIGAIHEILTLIITTLFDIYFFILQKIFKRKIGVKNK